MKKVLLALFTCLALAACLLVLTEYPLNVDFLRGTLEHELESKLGCRVAIDGPIQVAVGFKPTFWLKNMSLAKLPSSGDGPPLARMRIVKGKIDLFSLLKGDVRLSLLEIHKVKAYLHAGHDLLLALTCHPAFSPQSANQPSTLFEIRRFSLKKLQILRPTPTGEAQVCLALDTVTGTLPLDAHLKLKAEGRYQGAPFSFEASGKSLRTWRERTQPWPLKISFHAGEAYVRFETAIAPPSNGADLTGRFSLACSNIESLGLFFGANLPEFGWLDLKSRFEAKSNGLYFIDFTGQVAALGGSVFSGEFRTQPHPAGLKVEAHLESNRFHIEKLAHLLVKADSWRGIIDSVAFTGASQGASLKDFLANLTGEVRLGNASLFFGDQRSSTLIFVDSLIATLSTGQHLSCSVSGRRREEPFAIEFMSGPLEAYVRGKKVPISLTAQSCEARVEGSGSISRFTDAAGLDLKFKATGETLKSLGSWLDGSPLADLPYHLDGRLVATLQSLSLTQLAGKIGQSHFAGELVWRGSKPAPRLSVKLHSQTLQLAELLSLASAQKTIRSERTGGSDMVLSVLSSMPSTDFEIEVDRLLGAEQDLGNLGAHGYLKAGQLEASVSGDLWDTGFAGNLEAEINPAAIQAKMHLSGYEVNISKLLRRAGVDQNLELSARFLELEFITRGNNLETLANGLNTTIRLKDVAIRGRILGTPGYSSLVISQAQVKVPPNSPLTATAEILIHQKLAKLELRSDLGPKDRIPFDLVARMDDARLTIAGKVNLPWFRPQVNLSFQLSGRNLNSLPFISRPNMPALGPYSFAGNFSTTPKHYTLTRVDLRLGTSRLTGNMDFIPAAKRSRFKAHLLASTLQLDDFVPYLRGSNKTAAANPTGLRRVKSDQATNTMKDFENWLRQLMRRVDVDLSMQAMKVLSGKNRLGRGQLALTIKNGRLSLNEFTGGAFKGKINLGLVLEETGRKFRMETWGKVRHMDYRFLARLLRRQTMKGGDLSLDFRFTGVTPSIADFLAHANGYFQVAARPRQLEKPDSGYWFVDFVFAVIPLLELGPAPQIKCVAGNFNLKDGLAPETSLLIDLTDEKIKGVGTIDFKTRTLNLVFSPEPKKLVFKIPLPVKVSGTFADYKVTPTLRKLLVTWAHYVLAPIKQLFSHLFPGIKIDPCTQIK